MAITTVPHAHDVLLRGLGETRGRGPQAPTLIERRDEDFVQALTDELRGATSVAAVVEAARRLLARPRRAGAPLTLYPPMQRVNHLVLVEACCAEPGFPRLDPRRIAGAGMVVRRVDGTARQAWVQVDRRPAGWRGLASSRAAFDVHEDDDPDAAQRPPRLSAGHPWINARLAANRAVSGPAASTERIVPLHPMPPDVCERLGRTLLFGWLPVGSSEVVDDDAPSGTLPPVDDTDLASLQRHFAHYAQPGELKALPRPGEAVIEGWLNLDDPAYAALEPFVTLLLQLRNEFDAFGTSPQSQAVAAALQPLAVLRVSADAKAAVGAARVAEFVQVCLAWDPTLRDAAAFDPGFRLHLALRLSPHFPSSALDEVDRFLRGLEVESAAPFLLDATAALTGEPTAPVYMADYWLPVSAEAANRLTRACAASAAARFDRLFVAGRAYSEAGQNYELRCFIRARRGDGCPPALVWSGYAGPFTVAPWWESAGVKPRLVPMPDPFDRVLLRQLKPGVAFAMPPKLANLMTRSNLKKLKDGDAPDTPGLDIQWVCGFNIPIITLCAMIVLHIFLILLNLVFWWLPFIKVCIPLPRPK